MLQKSFNDGLTQHLREGGYIQSMWDQCLFYKWDSILSYVYVLFHVDDFILSATNEGMLDEFQTHMSTKYEMTANDDGIFLGVHMCPNGDGSYIFRKPGQL